MIDDVRLLIALVTLIQTSEDFVLRTALATERPWAFVREEIPFRVVFDRVYGARGLNILLATRFASAVALLLWPRPIDAAILVVGTWLCGVRWRGTFNGGSDAMTLIVLIGIFIALVAPTKTNVAEAYVAAHVVVSFVVAGLVKLRNGEWRDGSAPQRFLADAGLKISRRTATALGWATILFEVTFPAALLNASAAVAYVTLAMLFHLTNAYVFGLNRFLWAWGAAYPALIAVAQRVGAG